MFIQEVIKRDKKKEKFLPEKIKKAINSAVCELYSRNNQSLTNEIFKAVIDLLEKEKQRIISLEKIQDIIEKAMMQRGFNRLAKVFILYRRYRSQIREIKKISGIKDDLKLSLNSFYILHRRYLLKNAQGKVVETPKQMFMRVAKNIAQAERNYQSKNEGFWRDEFYQAMAGGDFLPNSPTLMNAGTNLGQLSACFVLPVKDSMKEIFETLGKTALIHKSGGGTGFDFSLLRPKGDLVSSTKAPASGPLSFMEIFDKATSVVMQGGKRRGANMGIMSVDHPDIVDFITAKKYPHQLSNFNLSVAVTDKFMAALKENKYFNLVNPRSNKIVKRMKARFIFDLIVSNAYLFGDPGLVFIDQINRSHPLKGLGRIKATNPCGEVPLLDYESCNLGSINLSRFVKGKNIDWGRLEKIVFCGVRFLDNVIEVNKYPFGNIKKMTFANRKIGLGVMGFADMLIKLAIPYGSLESIRLSQRLMKFIHEASLRASVNLAKRRGIFPNWKHSVYKKRNLKLRNATLNSIAPTGTISLIADCSSGIEPLFGLSYSRTIFGNTQIIQTNPLFEDFARKYKFYTPSLLEKIRDSLTIKHIKGIPPLAKKIFVTAFDLEANKHLLIQAAFQKYTDNAVSKTINLPSFCEIEEVKRIFLKAYQLKLKGVTVYRYGSNPEQVINTSSNLTKDSFFSSGCFQRNCPF